MFVIKMEIGNASGRFSELTDTLYLNFFDISIITSERQLFNAMSWIHKILKFNFLISWPIPKNLSSILGIFVFWHVYASSHNETFDHSFIFCNFRVIKAWVAFSTSVISCNILNTAPEINKIKKKVPRGSLSDFFGVRLFSNTLRLKLISIFN